MKSRTRSVVFLISEKAAKFCETAAMAPNCRGIRDGCALNFTFSVTFGDFILSLAATFVYF